MISSTKTQLQIALLLSPTFDKQSFVGCEIGVWGGLTSKIILCSFPGLFLYMIDPWKSEGTLRSLNRFRSQKRMDDVMGEAIKTTKFAQNRRQIIRKTSLSALDDFDDLFFDFVFVDGDHTYEGVKDDMRWWSKVKNGGIFFGHDYDGRHEKRKTWGVKKSVDEFAEENGLTVNLHPHLLWSIFKTKESL